MSSGYEFSTRTELDTAVNLWISNEASAIDTYGNINELHKIIKKYDLAAVKMEVGRSNLPDINFLKQVRDLTSKKKIIWARKLTIKHKKSTKTSKLESNL